METKNIKPLENFDWDAFENDGKNAASVAEETKAYESTLNNVSDSLGRYYHKLTKNQYLIVLRAQSSQKRKKIGTRS